MSEIWMGWAVGAGLEPAPTLPMHPYFRVLWLIIPAITRESSNYDFHPHFTCHKLLLVGVKYKVDSTFGIKNPSFGAKLYKSNFLMEN
jgi:hypothetical protein